MFESPGPVKVISILVKSKWARLAMSALSVNSAGGDVLFTTGVV